MPTFRFQDGNQGIYRYNRFNEFQEVNATDTRIRLEYDTSNGAYDPTENPFTIVMSIEGAESYTVMNGPNAGATQYTAGTITSIDFLDDEGNLALRINNLDASLSYFSAMYNVGNLTDFFDYLNSAGSVYQGSNDASGAETANTGDQIETGAGDDTVNANGGNDFMVDGGGSDIYRGGAGTDTVSYADWYNDPLGVLAGIDAKLNKGRIVGPDGNTDRVKGVEDVRGTFLDDRFIGNKADNTFVGYGGNDFFNGRGGIDFVDYRYDEFQGGLDGIVANLENGRVRDGFGNVDRLRGIEGIRGTDNRDTITDSSDGDTMIGRGGRDRFNISGGNDYIEGNGGGDRFVFIGTDFGRDTLRDYDPGEGDVIVIQELQRFNQLTIEQDGVDVRIRFEGNQILLREYDASDLSRDDFGV